MSGSVPKCHGSATLTQILYFTLLPFIQTSSSLKEHVNLLKPRVKMDADPGGSIYWTIFDHVDRRSRHFFTSLYNIAVKDENPTRTLFCASWSPIFLTCLFTCGVTNCPWSRLGLSGNVRYGIFSFSFLLSHQSTLHLRVASGTPSISCIWS